MVVVVVVTVFHFFTKVGICMGLCIAFSVKTYRRSFQTTAFPHSFLELHFSPFCGYVVIYLTRTLTVQYGIFVKIMVHPIISSFLDSLLYRLLHNEFPAVRILSQSYSFEVLQLLLRCLPHVQFCTLLPDAEAARVLTAQPTQ